MTRYNELDLSNIRTYSAGKRASLVKTAFEGVPIEAGSSVHSFLDSLPDVLKARDIKAVARAVALAGLQGKTVIAMFGGHVVKCGCIPILLDLARNGFITHFASNGAASIHDTEMATFGQTSEDVAAALEDGSFGMAEDTAALLNGAASRAHVNGEGLGEALGASLTEMGVPHPEHCMSIQAYAMNIPYTVHVALGTDIVHQHPTARGEDIGDASLRDFRIFAATVASLNGGVVLNFGSAVVMPEVFLKALSAARNLGNDAFNFTTANFDMIQHYRPNTNVVKRPVLHGGNGYSITGHHENHDSPSRFSYQGSRRGFETGVEK